MGLPDLLKWKNGLYVRIWLWDAKGNYVLNISRDGLNNSASIIQWSGKTVDNVKYIVINKEWRNLVPKAGWDNLFTLLEKYKIPDLSSGDAKRSQMPDHLTHMTYTQFEIVRSNQYRFYEYLEPAFCRYIDSGSNDIYQFLKSFNKEMNVNIYTPDDSEFIDPKYRRDNKRDSAMISRESK